MNFVSMKVRELSWNFFFVQSKFITPAPTSKNYVNFNFLFQIWNFIYFQPNIKFMSSKLKLIASEMFNKRSQILWSFFKNTWAFQKHKWSANKRRIWICIIYAINNNFRKQIATPILWQVGTHLTARLYFILIFKRILASNILT